jgi:drug/metabolite transporter (DMT)-like permease
VSAPAEPAAEAGATVPAADAAPNRPLAAAGWMGLAILSFAAMMVAGRELSAQLNTFEIMFYRSAVGFPLVALALWRLQGWRGAATARPGRHITRNIVHFAGQNLWFYALALIPLAQLTALEFTSPLWIAALAPFLLGEKMTRAKLAAAALGFVGVLVIARPGVAPLEAGHLAALGSALGFALTNMMTKDLMRQDSALCVIFWMTLSQMGMGLLCALPGGLTLFAAQSTPLVIFIGVAGLLAHLALTRALGAAPATTVAPMEFMRLPVVAAAGLLIYGEALEIALALGAALILLGNILNLTLGRTRRG